MIRKTPMRKCLGCQEMKNKQTLIRIVKSKEGTFTVDLTGKMNGRGAYICQNIACFDKVEKSKGLNRAFKCQVPETVYKALHEEIKHSG